jgi:sugar phosphate isomerase/epimerase
MKMACSGIDSPCKLETMDKPKEHKVALNPLPVGKNEIHLGGTAHSLDDVKTLHGLGLQFAEIPVIDPDNFAVLKEGFMALKKDLGIYYLCHGPREGDPNNIKDLENEYIPKLMRTLSIMTELDMTLLTLHFWMDPRFVNQKTIAYKIVALKKLIERAKDVGITICLENLSESSTHLAGVFASLPPLKLTLDIGHAQLLSKKNTSHGIIKKYPERIRHIHLHDNRGGDSPADDLHLPVGEGIIHFERIFKRLKTIGYCGTISIELKPHEIEKCLGRVKYLIGLSGNQD